MASDNLNKLPTCYVSPVNGTAYFDGITIEADSIKALWVNRVLPVVEEKQILMCRQMSRLLDKKKNAVVLDVGTGNGVFAIWAAVMHECRVIAVDSSGRALRVAKDNAKRNNVESCDNPSELKDGQICFIQATFGDSFNDYMEKKYNFSPKEKFDFIFLSPPNMLTCSTIEPTLYVYGGRDGQKPFNQQIQWVSSALKEKGYCVGIQMTPVDENGIPESIRSLADAFTQKCDIHWMRIIDQDISTKELLLGQYKTISESSIYNKKLVDEYIADICREINKFSFIYYEVVKTEQGLPKENHPRFLPIEHQKTWIDRILVYRNIVDYSGPRGYFPTPSFYTSDFPGDYLSSSIPSKEEEIQSSQLPRSKLQQKKQKTNQWNKTPLRIIDDRIRRQVSQADGDFLFDVIVIETAPVVREIGGISDTFGECKVWILNQKDDFFVKEGSRRILEEWQLHTRCQQKSMLGCFPHPSFSGALSTEQWGQACQSTFSQDITLDEGYEKIWKKYLKRLKSYWKEISDNPEELLENIEFDNEHFYTYFALEALGVPEQRKYCEELIKPERMHLLNSSKYAHLYEQIEQNKDDVIRSLQGLKPFSKHGKDWCEMLAEDLEICHKTMHGHINKRMKFIARELDVSHRGFSMFIGLPLLLQKSRSQDNVVNPLENYRGGLWVYAASYSDWTLKHERYLSELAKFASLIYSEEYSTDAAKDRQEVVEVLMKNAFGHEVKHISNAFTQEWVRPLTDLFDVECVVPESRELLGKIGRIQIYDANLAGELGIVPFRDTLKTTGSLINLWCLLDNPEDIPFEIEKPEDITHFAELCWQFAVNVISVYALAGDIPDSQECILKIKEVREAIRKIYGSVVVNGSFPSILWGKEKRETIWLARILISTFSNCVLHSDPTKSITLSIFDQGNSFYLFKVENACKRLSKQDVVRDLLFKGLELDESLIKLTIDYLYQGISRGQSLERAKFSHKRVLDLCLESLEGEIIQWPSYDSLKFKDVCNTEILLRYLGH